MFNYQLQVVGDEFVTFIDHDDEFYVNLLFDRSIYRPMCTHMGKAHPKLFWSCTFLMFMNLMVLNRGMVGSPEVCSNWQTSKSLNATDHGD